MSDPTGPTRRRRIAGESKPAAPAQKPARRIVPARKVAGRNAATPGAVASPPTTPAKAVATTKTARPKVPIQPAGKNASRFALRGLVPVALVAVAVLALGVALMIKGVSERGGDSGDALDTSRGQAVSAAGPAAETIFSFSSDKLPQHESAAKALMTTSFGKDFAKIAPALTEVTKDRTIVVKAVTREAAPMACGDECSTTKVDVLVFLDQARLVGSSKEPTVFANRISVSMVKTDDGWLVDNIRAL
jgi:Mce-associated membrane protein